MIRYLKNVHEFWKSFKNVNLNILFYCNLQNSESRNLLKLYNRTLKMFVYAK